MRYLNLIFTILLLLYLASYGFAEEGENLIIERIIIKGNVKTDSSLIKRFLPLKERELLDQDKVEFARLRLLSTGFFSEVFISIEKGSERGFVNLIIEVKERGTLYIDEIHLGLSSVNQYWGGLSLTESNLLGRGFRLTLGAVYGEHFLTSRIKFINPSVSGTNHRLGFEILYNDVSERTREKVTDEVIELMQYRRLSGTFIHGLKLENFIYGYFYYTFEGIDAKVINQVEDDTLDIKPGRSYLSSVAIGISKDKRDDIFMPRRGYYTSIYFEIANALIYSDYEYAKLTFDLEYIIPSFSNQSLKMRLFAGSVQGDAPFFKKFFVGDYFYFVYGRTTLPRIWGVNTGDVIKYKSVAMMGELSYSIPAFTIKDLVYKSYFYITMAASHTASIEEFKREGTIKPSEEIVTPISFDVGFKADTEYGVFNFSLAYVLDVLIDRF